MKINEIFPNFSLRILDTMSIGTVLGTLFGYLPNIAALLTIVWTCIRIRETKTFEEFKLWLEKALHGKNK